MLCFFFVFWLWNPHPSSFIFDFFSFFGGLFQSYTQPFFYFHRLAFKVWWTVWFLKGKKVTLGASPGASFGRSRIVHEIRHIHTKKDKWWCDAVCLVFFVFHPFLGVKWRRFFITIRRRVLPMEYKQTWKQERNISLMHNAYSRFCASSAIWQHHERAPCMLLASRSLIIVIRAYIHSGWYSKDVIGRLLASPVNTSYVAAILGK